jgi:sugar/nucleoside kinase (ribokinase family)
MTATCLPGVSLPVGRPFDVVGFGLNAVDHLCTVAAFPRPDSKQRLADYACAPGGNVATALVAGGAPPT